jgi:hypothetical protein
MKKLLIVAVLVFSSSIIFAQEQNFKKNSLNLNAGIGIGGHYAAWNSYSSQSPEIGISADYGIIDNVGPGTIGAGLYLGYKKMGYKENYYDGSNSYYYKWNWTYTIVGVRGTYYYTLDNPKIEVYGGALLGVLMEKFKHKSNDPYWQNYEYNYGGSDLSLTVFAGGKFNITKKLGIFGEVGYGISYLTLGASLKLK